MPKSTHQTSALAPLIDTKKLKHGMKILVETESYLYEFEVVNTRCGAVKIETGDPRIESGMLTDVLPLQKGELLSILWSDGGGGDINGDERKLLGPVISVLVSGGEGDDSWSYEVF